VCQGKGRRSVRVSATVTSVSSVDDQRRPRRDRCTTPDGLDIAVYDFGGEGGDLLLAHATGFCAEVFSPLAGALGDRYHCWGLDLRAHGQSDRPGDGNFAWSGFATDVLSAIDHLGLDQPAAFGHSCGGASVLLAEEAKPGTFSTLYCFEPVIFPEPDHISVAALGQDNPLSTGARRRRDTFPSAEDAFLNFASKPPFADLDPDVLRCYVEAGFELIPDDEGGDGRSIRLLCRREDEAEVYFQGGAHRAFAHLHEIDCRVTLGCGQATDAFGLPFLDADAAQLRHATVEVIPGIGHFGPLQQPGLVADAVLRAFETVDDTPPS
jgi:pimeloyl-ACP methyl ester carboxylesterase